MVEIDHSTVYGSENHSITIRYTFIISILLNSEHINA